MQGTVLSKVQKVRTREQLKKIIVIFCYKRKCLGNWIGNDIQSTLEEWCKLSFADKSKWIREDLLNIQTKNPKYKNSVKIARLYFYIRIRKKKSFEI